MALLNIWEMLMMKNCCFEWNAKYTLMPEAKESLQFFDAIWTHCARMRPIFASAAQFVCECEIISSILISSFERFTAAVSYSELYMCKNWTWAWLCRWLWLGESHVSWPFCKYGTILRHRMCGRRTYIVALVTLLRSFLSLYHTCALHIQGILCDTIFVMNESI